MYRNMDINISSDKIKIRTASGVLTGKTFHLTEAGVSFAIDFSEGSDFSNFQLNCSFMASEEALDEVLKELQIWFAFQKNTTNQ